MRNKFTLKRFGEGLLMALVVLIVITIGGLIDVGLKNLYLRTGSLGIYFLYVNFGSLIGILIYLTLVILLICIITDKDRSFRNWLKAKWKKALPITTGILVLIGFISNCFDVSKSFKVCRIDGETPSGHAYNFAILADAFSGRTETVELDISQIEAGSASYTYRTSRGRFYHGSRTGTTYYISFPDKEGKKYADRLCNNTAVKYIRELKTLSDKITEKVIIEYYPHSGIVKSIDGYSPYDEKGLTIKSEEMSFQHDEIVETEEKKAAEEKAERSRRFSVIYNDMMPKVPGITLDEVKKMMSDADVPFDEELKVIYLSTKHFDPGTVAYFDLPGRTLYVVKDQLFEGMVAVPHIDKTMTVKEIMNALDKAGITYECSGYDPNANQRLNTVHCAPGTLIPKYQYTYWFSVR